MKILQEKRKEFLDDTVAHFSVNVRATASIELESGRSITACKYSHDYNGGCAIGRKISKKLASELDNIDDSGVTENHIFVKLPKELRELGQNFLTDIQGLHDFTGYWDEEGLNEAGIFAYNRIVKNYCK